MLYHVVLVSVIQQCKSVITVYIYPLLLDLPPPHPSPLSHHGTDESFSFFISLFIVCCHQLYRNDSGR